ncbi:hypothetical protein PCANB_002160 [Pneumocystis canis]|nr:hypothetical protein PCK1_001902 [Pneumocystis canis]KAG5439584.1 hypothetical protein PCANB_002160 [Pneumocystis canis]
MKLSNESTNFNKILNEDKTGHFNEKKDFKTQTVDEWIEEAQRNPFFMKHYDKTKDNTILEAFRALQYEGEPIEIVENFKFQGDECFKVKKYHDAIEYYTKALKIETGNDIEILCLLNRSACHLKLKNYRQTLNDCNQVLKKNPYHMKALYRSAKAYFFLDKLEESLECINKCLKMDYNDIFKSFKEKTLDRKKYLDKKAKEAYERENFSLIKKKILNKALKERGIIIKLSPIKPDLNNFELCLTSPLDSTSTLLFPMIFLYPLVLQSDFITEVPETTTIQEQLNIVLTSTPEWDKDKEYHPLNVEVCMETKTNDLIKVKKDAKLLDVLKEKIEILDGIIRLLILPKDKIDSWMSKEKQKL